MAIRTNEASVRLVIETDADTSLTGFITTANAITDYVASKDEAGVLTSALLLQIETYLAAHFYAVADPQYRSKTTGKASASFERGKEGEGFKATTWGQQAIAMDITGTLGSMATGVKKAQIIHLGLPTQSQTDWIDRNYPSE